MGVCWYIIDTTGKQALHVGKWRALAGIADWYNVTADELEAATTDDVGDGDPWDYTAVAKVAARWVREVCEGRAVSLGHDHGSDPPWWYEKGWRLYGTTNDETGWELDREPVPTMDPDPPWPAPKPPPPPIVHPPEALRVDLPERWP
jgi:hypothetical protein